MTTAVDVLGAPYTAQTLESPDDYEGPVVATLVHRPADGTPIGSVLYVHGYCDYFFQTVTADFFANLGYDFFALDLRKHGRSLLPHQTPNFCLDLAEYFPELDRAVQLIRERHANSRLLLMGHSTGGLTVPLWAAVRAAAGPAAAAMILDSPWLDLPGSAFARTAGTRAIQRLGAARPYTVIPRTVSGAYGEALHRDYHGEWDFNLSWKPINSFPVRAGWLRAIRLGHLAVHRGIDVGMPVLTVASTRSSEQQHYDDEAACTDTVLDVEQIARWAPSLGRRVTV
ncbi:MAG: alpha/beta hydrolase, partial [Sciscionella sp.]